MQKSTGVWGCGGVEEYESLRGWQTISSLAYTLDVLCKHALRN